MPKSYRCKECNSAPHHCNCHRISVEKCPHHNPAGKCPQCNLARSFGYFNTDDELEESIENSDNSGITETEDEEREVREVVESYRIEDNSTSTGEGQRSELFTTMTNSAKEKKDAKRNIHEENETWPSCIPGIIFPLVGVCLCYGFYSFVKKIFSYKERTEIKSREENQARKVWKRREPKWQNS